MCELYLVSDEWGYVFVSKHECNNKNRLPLWPLYFPTGWKSNRSDRTLDVENVRSRLFVLFCSLSACPEILDWQKVLVKCSTSELGCWAQTFPDKTCPDSGNMTVSALRNSDLVSFASNWLLDHLHLKHQQPTGSWNNFTLQRNVTLQGEQWENVLAAIYTLTWRDPNVIL